jgi:hypothetical protein
MTKLSHFLASGLFTVVCAGVWFALRIAKVLLAEHLDGASLSAPMAVVLNYHDWLWALPVPAIAYSAILLDRHEVLLEMVVLYALIMVCASALLLVGTAGFIGWEISNFYAPSVEAN